MELVRDNDTLTLDVRWTLSNVAAVLD
jgi:hypothetical protein